MFFQTCSSFLDYANDYDRQHPAVVSKAQQVFHNIVLALEAETFQGRTATEVAKQAKDLVARTGINAQASIDSLSADGQATVKSFFA